MFLSICSYVKFKYERLSLFCFYCGRLGHSDSFCKAKMAVGVEITDMGCNLSLRAKSRRAQATNSVWLREDGGVMGGIYTSGQFQGNSGWGADKKRGCLKDIDPILGFNLEGTWPTSQQEGENSLSGQIQNAMDHDLEDDMVIGEERKKRARGDIEESSNVILRNRRLSEINYFSSAAAMRQADPVQ